MGPQKNHSKKAYLPTNFERLNEWQKKEVAVINMWLSSKSKITRKNYLYLYEALKTYVPGLPVWELDTVHFAAFFTKICVGKTKRTMALYRSIFMSLMEYVAKLGLAASNPVLKTTEYKLRGIYDPGFWYIFAQRNIQTKSPKNPSDKLYYVTYSNSVA